MRRSLSVQHRLSPHKERAPSGPGVHRRCELAGLLLLQRDGLTRALPSLQGLLPLPGGFRGLSPPACDGAEMAPCVVAHDVSPSLPQHRPAPARISGPSVPTRINTAFDTPVTSLLGVLPRDRLS